MKMLFTVLVFVLSAEALYSSEEAKLETFLGVPGAFKPEVIGLKLDYIRNGLSVPIFMYSIPIAEIGTGFLSGDSVQVTSLANLALDGPVKYEDDNDSLRAIVQMQLTKVQFSVKNGAMAIFGIRNAFNANGMVDKISVRTVLTKQRGIGRLPFPTDIVANVSETSLQIDNQQLLPVIKEQLTTYLQEIIRDELQARTESTMRAMFELILLK
ncbi:hypothetical protein HDE_02836 [Halotydeus destructor]|nr:hypothetical protein HDE_02836 [Halotydeus destructor]